MRRNVGVKVKEIIEMDFLSEAQMLCGTGGLNNYITTVNVMEVPDIVNWVKPGEFLLTTAYSIKDDIQKLNELIPVMKNIGVAGIGIKTKRYIENLPDSVIETANNLDFPIVSIPLDVSFGDVITAVLTTVVNKQTNVLIQIDRFNSELKEIMLRGGDLNEIAEMIHGVVRSPIAITEEIFKDYVIVAGDSVKKDIDEIVEKTFFKKSIKNRRKSQGSEVQRFSDVINGKEVSRLMIPIYSDEMAYGYVVLWELEQQVSESTLFMIQAATSLIALNSSKKLSVYENENKHKIEFIEELLSQNESRQFRAIEKASYFDFDRNNLYGVIVASLSDKVKYTPNNSKMLKQMNAKLITVVERLHRNYGGELIYGNKSDRVIFLLGFDPVSDQEVVKNEMMKFASELKSFAKLENIHKQLSIGVGRAYGDYKELYKSYREAQRVIQNLSLHHDGSSMLHFDELGIYRILSHEDIQPELYQFFIETLGPIVDYDREKDAELLDTLKKYYECGCNLKKVSEEMYTHYNTVIYRMQRIREIGSIDFNDANTTLNVHIALKILDVLKPELLLNKKK